MDMKLYLFLQSRVPKPLAVVLTGLWFALLIVVAFFFANEPQAVFRYGNI